MKLTKAGFAISLATLLCAATQAGDFSIDWHTIDGGGGTSVGGDFELSGTIGQPDAGVLTGGDFELVGGFWGVTQGIGGGLVGDLNCDGAVSVSDIGPFVLALTDPASYAVQFPDCDIISADVNNDGFVTVSDIGPFVALLTGV